MAFEIGDKVLTSTGLYISGEWRERGLKGKVVDVSSEFGGLLTVKFKGIEELRFLRPEYLILRKKKNRPFKEGDTVALKADVQTNAGSFSAGADAEVTGLIPDSNLVEITFLYGGAELTVAEEVLTRTEVVADKPAEGPEEPRPFEVGDTVVFVKDYGNESLVAAEGTYAEVTEVLPHGEVLVEFDDYTTEVVPEDVLAFEGADDPFGESEEPDGTVPDLHEVKDNPEVQDALALILDRIEEIKALLTTQPKSEVHFTIHPSNGLTEEEVAEALQKEEEPAPEPVFKKAKEVKAGDLLATEAGVWDKVDRIDTKASGYTSLYGVFGNRIAQVPSGRVVQVLEEVS